MLRRVFLSSLLLVLLLCLQGGNAEAQGWSFTETVNQTGWCIPRPPSPYNGLLFATRSACESIRQQELNDDTDWSVEGDGSCVTTIICTPCTGSDMNSPATVGSSGVGNPGVLNLNGLATGNPFFSSHQSMEVENWINDIVQMLKSMGYPVEMLAAVNSQDLPLTGNSEFDKWYAEQYIRFEKPEQGGTVYFSEGQDVIDPNDLKKPPVVTAPAVESRQVVSLPSSDKVWYHLEPLPEGGVPPLPEGSYDPSARYPHPRIEIMREAGVTMAGWLPDGAAYPGIVAVNIWAENAKAIQDIRDGNAPQDAVTSLKNAYENSLKDVANQAIGDAKGAGFEKAMEIVSGSKGIAKLASGIYDTNEKWKDMGGKVAGGEGEGIFGKITKVAKWSGNPYVKGDL